jgi:hypothetical protein
MPSIVTATELRNILGVSSSLYNDAYLNEICDTAENVILPLLVKYQAAIGAAELSDDVATFDAIGEHKFSEGQQVVIAGVSATFNGTRTITSIDEFSNSFTAAITAADVNKFNVIPSGTATLVGASTYVGNPNVKSAVLATSVEVFQSRTAAGGQIEGVDFTVSPFRLGRSLFNRVSGLLGPYLDTDAMVG